MTPRWVLLHGFTGHPRSWDEVAPALAAHGDVLRPALVGHAPDTGPPTDFTSEVDRIAGLIAAQGPGPNHVCGYSLGGRVALGLLVRHPTLFNRATLIGAHPGLPDGSNERNERAATDERWTCLAESAPSDFVARWSAQPLFQTQLGVEPERRLAQQRLRESHDVAALGAALRALSLARMPDWRPHLMQLGMPVHLIVGELDSKFVALVRQMKEQIGAATLTIVPGAGHNVLLERPAAIIHALLEPTLDASGAAGGAKA